MADRAEPYRSLDAAINQAAGSSVGIRVLIGADAHCLSRTQLAAAANRYDTIRRFQRTCLRLFLDDGLPFRLRGLGRLLPRSRPWDEDLLLPLFFRTDESLDARIFEIQCPGSWWGTCQVIQEHQGYPLAQTLAKRFGSDVGAVFQGRSTIDVLHIFSSSSSPQSNHYFAQRVRAAEPRIRYWGIDRGVTSDSCSLVRAHSYKQVVSEDLFDLRLAQLAANEMRFDHPPVPIFDQKFPIALPFHRETARMFSDAERALFPHTSLVESDGSAILEDGSRASLAEVARDSLAYYLKYAGLDTTRNFGGRAVYRLGGLNQELPTAISEKVLSDVSDGEPWILQRAADSTTDVKYVAEDGAIASKPMNARLCSFYGPTGLLGMVRHADTDATLRSTGTSVVSLVQTPSDHRSAQGPP